MRRSMARAASSTVRMRRPTSATPRPSPRSRRKIAAECALRSAARRGGPGKPRSRSGSIRSSEAAFREQDFGAWTGRRHDDLVAELGDVYRDFWKSPASNAPPGGESFVDQIGRTVAGPRGLAGGRCRAGRAFRHDPRRARDRARSRARRRAAFCHRSVVADADRPARKRLAGCRGQSALKRALPRFSRPRSRERGISYPFRRSPRSVGSPMPAASKPPSTARICPVM